MVMESATYEIPIIVPHAQVYPWHRLYSTPTHSWAARARAIPSSYSDIHFKRKSVKDSLEWTLKSAYDHQVDLFTDKPDTMRRDGFDKRKCQKGQMKTVKERKTLEVLRTDEKDQVLPRRFDADLLNAAMDKRRHKGPRVVIEHPRNSLMTFLTYSQRPIHTLTAPKASTGYARNPNGAFFTS